MPTYKPVGVDENSDFPTRVLLRLRALFSAGGETHIFRNPTGSVTANMNIRGGTPASQAVLTSGVSRISLLGLSKRAAVTGIGFITGTTAATSPTNWWVALLDSTGKIVAVSADKTTTAIPANTLIQVPFTVPITLPSGTYYAVLMVAASTVPTLVGITGIFTAVAIAPISDGNTTTTGSTTPPALGASIPLPTTQSNSVPFFYVY